MSLSPACEKIWSIRVREREKEGNRDRKKKKRRKMRGEETEKRGEYLMHSFKHVVLEILSITYSSAKGSHPLCHVRLYTGIHFKC